MIKRSTWILLAVLALFIGAYFYLKAHPLQLLTSTPTPTATESSFLITKGNDTLTKVVITDAQGNTFQMGRDATGNWAIMVGQSPTIMVGQSPTITQPELAAADQSQAEAAETQLFALSVLTTLETSPSLDVIGLNPPAYTISLEFSSNGQQVLKVGALTPTGSGYYVQVEDKIYVISQSSIEAVLELLKNPPYAATPTPVPVMVATATIMVAQSATITETPIPATATQ
jgi:hypothetical protein